MKEENTVEIEDVTEAAPAFKPVSIKITFKSQKMLDAWGRLFNFTPFCDRMISEDGDPAETLKKWGANISWGNSRLSKHTSFSDVISNFLEEDEQ